MTKHKVTAFIRSHFRIDGDKYFCSIGDCKSIYPKSTQITNLKYHIKNKHELIWTKYEQMLEETKKVPPIIKERPLQEDNIWARTFASNSLPYSLIENKHFTNAISFMCRNGLKLPNKKRLREDIVQEAKTVRNDTISELASCENPVTICLDVWTNVRKNKVTNIMAIANTQAYFIGSVENKETNNTAQWLFEQICPIFTELLEKGVRIVAIAADNAHTMSCLVKLLQVQFPIILHVPCGAHTLQLCLKQICMNEYIKDVITQIDSIISCFDDHIDFRSRLTQLQRASNVEIPLSVIHRTENRWSSLINCADRLLKLRQYISIILGISDETWIKIQTTIEFLRIFKQFTNRIQTDSANLYTEWESFKFLQCYFENECKLETIFSPISREAISILNREWIRHVNHLLVASIALLSFDNHEFTNIENVQELIEFVCEWGASYITTYKLIENVEKQNIKQIIELQLSNYIAKQGQFNKICSIVEGVKSLSIKNNQTFNCKLVWGKYLLVSKELAMSALALLQISPSEACVERSFADQTDVHTIERNRLDKLAVESEMHIKWKYRKLLDTSCIDEE